MHEKIEFAELRASGGLPSPKGVALKVMQMCQDEHLSLKDLAQTIQGDPALAGRIIKIANYVNPNRSRPIASVTTDTLILIGIHAVRQVVLGLSLVGDYRDGKCKLFDYEQFWSFSVAMGSAAQAISAAIRVTAPAEMFNCGLMSGIGQLALVTVRPEAYCELLTKYPNASLKTLQEAQLEYFGMAQRDMMVFMLQDWGIPKLFIDALYYHEDPLSSGYAENSRPLRITYALQLASLLARACVESEVDKQLLARIKAFGTLLEIETERLDDIAEQTLREWQEWCSVLGIQVRRTPPAPIKAEEITAPAAETAPAAAIELISPEPTDPLNENVPPITPLRVLVASANELQCNILSKALVPHGHTVNIVNSGQKALSLIEEFKPHVLITDWLLPELDGVGLCKAVRKHPLGERIYCIVVTQFEDERRRVDAYEAGADELMRTPLNARMLSAQMLVAQRYAKIPDES